MGLNHLPAFCVATGLVAKARPGSGADFEFVEQRFRFGVTALFTQAVQRCLPPVPRLNLDQLIELAVPEVFAALGHLRHGITSFSKHIHPSGDVIQRPSRTCSKSNKGWVNLLLFNQLIRDHVQCRQCPSVSTDSSDRQWRQIVKLRMASIDGDEGPLMG